MLRLTQLLSNKATVIDDSPTPATAPTPPSLQPDATPAARLEAARAELNAIEELRLAAQQQKKKAITAGDVREAGNCAEQINALEQRRSAVLPIEEEARREVAQEASQGEWNVLEQERAEILRKARDCGAEMEAHGLVGRQITARWEGTFAEMQSWNRKRESLFARYGAAPDPIPFVDGRGMIEILGVTQDYVYGLNLSVAALAKMEQRRAALQNPRKPEPLPRLTAAEQRARDRRMGVVERVRGHQGTDGFQRHPDGRR